MYSSDSIPCDKIPDVSKLRRSFILVLRLVQRFQPGANWLYCLQAHGQAKTECQSVTEKSCPPYACLGAKKTCRKGAEVRHIFVSHTHLLLHDKVLPSTLYHLLSLFKGRTDGLQGKVAIIKPENLRSVLRLRQQRRTDSFQLSPDFYLRAMGHMCARVHVHEHAHTHTLNKHVLPLPATGHRHAHTPINKPNFHLPAMGHMHKHTQ